MHSPFIDKSKYREINIRNCVLFIQLDYFLIYHHLIISINSEISSFCLVLLVLIVYIPNMKSWLFGQIKTTEPPLTIRDKELVSVLEV